MRSLQVARGVSQGGDSRPAISLSGDRRDAISARVSLPNLWPLGAAAEGAAVEA